MAFKGRQAWGQMQKRWGASDPPKTLPQSPTWPGGRLTWGCAEEPGGAGETFSPTLSSFGGQVGVHRAGLGGAWAGLSPSRAVVASWTGAGVQVPWETGATLTSSPSSPLSGAAHSRPCRSISPALHQRPGGQCPQSSCCSAPGVALTV